MRRIVSLVVVLVLGLVPILGTSVMATDEIDAGLSEPLIPQYGRNGKFLAPIEEPAEGSIAISTRAELEAIKDNLSDTYHLTADIDLSGAEWVPLGDNNTRFTGIFDGQGYVIKNLTITGDKYQYNGLFGYTYEAEIKNVGLEGTNIDISYDKSYAYAGGICGYSNSSDVSNCYNTGDVSASASASASFAYAGGISGYSYESPVSNCYNTGAVSASSTEYVASAGGICGYSEISPMSNCYNTGAVSALSTEYNASAGGICGYAYSAADNCYNTGDVSVSAEVSAYVGGICGFTFYSDVSNCYNTGDVSASSTKSSASAGGICGDSNYDSAVSNCYNTGAVSASAESGVVAGGICGRSYDDSVVSNCYNTGDVSASSTEYDAYAGGICGYSSVVSNCYNTGDVSASSAESSALAGGICGYSSFVSNCYNTGDVSASAESSALAGGICGYSSVSNCYNTGAVSASSTKSSAYAGGICGRSSSAIVSNCYSLNLYGSAYGTQLSAAQMKDQTSYAEWDFSDIWAIDSSKNFGFPYLRGMTLVIPDRNPSFNDPTYVEEFSLSYDDQTELLVIESNVDRTVILLCAELDENGKLLTLEREILELTAGRNDYTPEHDYEPDSTTVFMLWDENMSPLCPTFRLYSYKPKSTLQAHNAGYFFFYDTISSMMSIPLTE